MRSILKVLILCSFCILTIYVLTVYFDDKSKEIKFVDKLVKPPIIDVKGDYCSVFEDDIFTFQGKNSFSECEVRKNPKLFDGKLIRINSRYGFMIHGSYLSDEDGCPEFSKSIDESIAVRFQSERDFDYIYSLKEIPIDIIAVGKFTVKTPSNASDTIYDRTPFDFEIICLEKAEKLGK